MTSWPEPLDMSLSDEPAAPPLPGAECRCEGTGWIQVQEAYAERRGKSDQGRAAAANSVYPCKVHKPRQFSRWVSGCWEPDHDRSSCDLCQAQPRRRRRYAPADDHDRKDVHG